MSDKKRTRSTTSSGSTPPSRRGFIAMLGGAAAVLALAPVLPAESDRPQSKWEPKNLWVGHF